MRRALIALAVLALSWPAQAQVFPNLPPNTFLGRFGAGQSGPPQAIPFTSFPFSLAVPFLINPPANTLTQAINTNSSAPLSGSQSTNFNFSEFNATNNGYKVSNALDPTFGGLASNSTLRANYTSGVSGNVNAAIWGAARETAPSANLTGIVGSAYANISATGDFLWGMIGFGNVGASGSVNTVIGVESSSLIATGGAAANRIGFSADTQSPVQGSTLDAAFAVTRGASAGIAPYNSVLPWQNGFVVSSGVYGVGAPLATTGNVLYSPDTFTIGSFANFANATVTNNILNFPNLAIAGNGAAVFGASVASIPPQGTLSVTGPSKGIVDMTAQANGVAGEDFLSAQTSSGNVTAATAVFEASNTSTAFGQTLGNWAAFTATGSSNSGAMFGTLQNVPVILGANNTAWLTITGSGSINSIGTIGTIINQNNSTETNVTNGSAGTSALAAFVASNSTNSATFGIGGTGYTAVAGLQNRAFINANSTAAGIILNNQGANPIVLGISSSEVGRWDAGTPGQLDLGLSGTTVGKLSFNNATSGSIVLAPPAGALGTVTLTLPDGTDTLTSNNASQTLANKTISGSNNTLSNISTNANFTLGGSATGVAGGATDFAGIGALCSTETSCLVPVSAPATMKNFYAISPTPPGAAQTYTFTVRRCPGGTSCADTSITCQMSGASATTCNDTTHTQAFSAGDAIDVKIVASGGATTTVGGPSYALTAVTVSP